MSDINRNENQTEEKSGDETGLFEGFVVIRGPLKRRHDPQDQKTGRQRDTDERRFTVSKTVLIELIIKISFEKKTKVY